MSALIELHQVHKSYALGIHRVPALRGVSIALREGEMLALTGPWGSGKSTILNLCGLIDGPDAGEVRLQGQAIDVRRTHAATLLRRDMIGFVFQGFNLVPVMTVAENVDYPLFLAGLAPRERARRVAEVLTAVGLSGQKVLMLGDDFWLLMPGSQRAMRITPTQKLLGDASTGDVATLSWSQDYRGRLVGEERCDEPTPQPCWHLSLQALRPGVSYQRIELWMGKQRQEPLRADLFVQSDKLAKQARFVFDRPGAPTLVTEMVLQDRLSHRRETRVRYLGRSPRQIPENWFNPMFLARNPSLD